MASTPPVPASDRRQISIIAVRFRALPVALMTLSTWLLPAVAEASLALVPIEEPLSVAQTSTDVHRQSQTVLPLVDRRLHGRRAFIADGTDYEFRGVHGHVDSRRFRPLASATGRLDARKISMPFAFAGAGYPNVAVLAQVGCMGESSRVVARRASRYVSMIEHLADQHGLSASLVLAVVAQESCFDPTAVSTAGALGLMQLMPSTARWLKAGNVRHPEANLKAGVRYLASMHATFGSTELALAAYNAGPGNVRRYGGIPPFSETRHYIRRVLDYQQRYARAALHASL